MKKVLPRSLAPLARGTASSPSSFTGIAANGKSFLDFAWSARKDIKDVVAWQSDLTWVQRVHALSVFALEYLPREAPHWRVSGPLVLPREVAANAFVIDVSKRKDSLSVNARASCFRALCTFRGGPQHAPHVLPLLAALVGSKGGLAFQLPLDELRTCMLALANSEVVSLSSSPLREFASHSGRRYADSKDQITFTDLYTMRGALQACGVSTTELDNEANARLMMLTRGDSQPPRRLEVKRDMTAVLAYIQKTQKSSSLRSPRLRQAMLPRFLDAETAAELLQHSVPSEEAFSKAHEFIVATATQSIAAGSSRLGARELSVSLEGVLRLQAHGENFLIGQAAWLLRALWPQVVVSFAHFSPGELSVVLRSYWWQLQYSLQELAFTGVLRDHPVVDVADAGIGSQRLKGKAMDQVKMKLLRPVFSRLGEMPLQHVAACLTAVAPPLGKPDILSPEEMKFVQSEVNQAFPKEVMDRSVLEGYGSSTWQEEFWLGELQVLSVSSLLELACGFREFGAEAPWVTKSLLSELDQRLSTAGSVQPSIELSHFLLLRLCRVMDLWHGHMVEDVLKQLFANPDAVRPLPTSYFVAVLQAICQYAIPKELPAKLVETFLQRVERGERLVQPQQWVDILAAIQLLDEGGSSWERVTPRVIQHVVPKISSLPAPSLSLLLQSLAARPHPGGSMMAESAPRYVALRQAQPAFTEAAYQAMREKMWNFTEVVSIFNSLARLGWSSEALLAAILAQCVQTPFLEPHLPLMLPLARSCVELRIHHAPLLQKMVSWYSWCCTYLRPKPMTADDIGDLLEFANQLLELSFHSLELQTILADNLKNPNASSKQLLALLAALAKFSHFPLDFKDTCSKVCANSTDSDLTSLSQSDLVDAFNIHLCAVFDGPAALKHWLTEDAAMKAFFQVHTSQKWYQKQDQERTAFLQSPAYLSLKSAAEEEGLDLLPSDPGEVYHIEFLSANAKQQLTAWPSNPPTAVVCIKSKEQLRWYMPITAEGSTEAEQMNNRCNQFRFMFRGAVQKMRHLVAMGYRPAVIWMSEWNQLKSSKERNAYLRAAVDAVGPRNAAFSPSTAEEEDMYR